MKIEILSSDTDVIPWCWVALWVFVWLSVLHRILTRSDFDTPAKILWVIVVIFVPFFGIGLYWLAAPKPEGDAQNHRAIDLQNDVAGTPWANNPGFKRDT